MCTIQSKPKESKEKKLEKKIPLRLISRSLEQRNCWNFGGNYKKNKKEISDQYRWKSAEKGILIAVQLEKGSCGGDYRFRSHKILRDVGFGRATHKHACTFRSNLANGVGYID